MLLALQDRLTLGEKMQLKTKMNRFRRVVGCPVVLLSASLTCLVVGAVAPVLVAQAPANAPANRFVGTITATGSGLLTVKTDAGAERKVTVPDGIRLQRIAPGEKDLSKAATIQFSDLSVGDRVLVRLAPEPTTDPVTAVSIIAIPQADLAQKQKQEQEEWQKNGVGGLVKSVDPGTGTIVIVSGAGPSLKTTTLHTTPTTVLRRYAVDSVDYSQSKPAPIETIHVGDQLRARGTKSADGTQIAAVEVVSGSFRNISGTISSVNASANTITLKDLATKQNVTVHIGPDAQMRKLPDNMAKVLASMTQSGGGAAPGAGAGANASSSGPGAAQAGGGMGASGSAPGGQPHTWSGAQTGNSQGGTGAPGGRLGQGGAPGGDWAARRAGGGDPQQVLSRAPAIHLSDLQKGDAVMLVSTQGTSDVTAVTLLAGVEPLLEAPASTQSMLLSNWNMSSGSAEAAQ
jgi:hypothetical protein